MSKLTHENNWRGDRISQRGRDMAIIDTSGWEWGEDIEPKVFSDGTRVIARIIDIIVKQNEDSKLWYMQLRMEVPDEPYYKEFGDFLHFLHPEMTPRERMRATRRWRSFERCFGIYLNLSGENDPSEWLTREGRVELNMYKGRDGQMYNGIKEYVAAE